MPPGQLNYLNRSESAKIQDNAYAIDLEATKKTVCPQCGKAFLTPFPIEDEDYNYVGMRGVCPCCGKAITIS